VTLASFQISADQSTWDFLERPISSLRALERPHLPQMLSTPKNRRPLARQVPRLLSSELQSGVLL
jgi:hypothetical protein